MHFWKISQFAKNKKIKDSGVVPLPPGVDCDFTSAPRLGPASLQ